MSATRLLVSSPDSPLETITSSALQVHTCLSMPQSSGPSHKVVVRGTCMQRLQQKVPPIVKQLLSLSITSDDMDGLDAQVLSHLHNLRPRTEPAALCSSHSPCGICSTS